VLDEELVAGYEQARDRDVRKGAAPRPAPAAS
jgi:hypothetical protein